MNDGQRIDWLAIPDRYRRWRALLAWRKLLWLVSRSVTMAVAHVAFGVGILWYNEPAVVEAVGAGRVPVWSLLAVLGARPELVAVLLLLAPAVVAGVLLPHRPAWQR